MCCETMCHTVCKREGGGGCAVRQCVTPCVRGRGGGMCCETMCHTMCKRERGGGGMCCETMCHTMCKRERGGDVL